MKGYQKRYWNIVLEANARFDLYLIDHFTYNEMKYIDNFSSDNVNVPCRFMYWCGQYCCYLLDNRGKSRLNCVVSRCMCVKMLPCCCYEVRSNWQRHATSIATIPSSYALLCVYLIVIHTLLPNTRCVWSPHSIQARVGEEAALSIFNYRSLTGLIYFVNSYIILLLKVNRIFYN